MCLQDKGQSFCLQLPDELTITHAWRDEKKHREYNFDQVCVFLVHCNAA